MDCVHPSEKSSLIFSNNFSQWNNFWKAPNFFGQKNIQNQL